MPNDPERKTPTPRLVLPDMAFADSYLEAVREGFTDSTARPMPEAAQMAADLPGHLARLNQQGGTERDADGTEVPLPPFTHFWLVAGEEFIGRTSLRTELNARQRRWGGHIGYGIRPDRQRRGFGHIVLALVKQRAVALGLTRVLLTCDDTNIGSWRIIEAGGGVLEDIAPHPADPARLARRYWITLTP